MQWAGFELSGLPTWAFVHAVTATSAIKTPSLHRFMTVAPLPIADYYTVERKRAVSNGTGAYLSSPVFKPHVRHPNRCPS